MSERENFCCTRCIWDRPERIDNFKIGSYKKRNRHIFVGNIVSSKLFNILAVFGITSVFEAINVNPEVV